MRIRPDDAGPECLRPWGPSPQGWRPYTDAIARARKAADALAATPSESQSSLPSRSARSACLDVLLSFAISRKRAQRIRSNLDHQHGDQAISSLSPERVR